MDALFMLRSRIRAFFCLFSGYRRSGPGSMLPIAKTRKERAYFPGPLPTPFYSLFLSRSRMRSFFATAASAAALTFSFISSKSRGSVSTTFFTGV